ncbi:MAG: alcohol dehydrogenase catalytic domain-containing protein [Beutenbergiaceae bacterium]
MTNTAAYVMGLRQMEMGDAPMPTVARGSVLIKMLYCGICGSDMHFYQDGEPEFDNLYPFVIGHEGSGVVVEVGAGVKTLAVGDRVVIEPGIPCRTCQWCAAGRYNLCAQMTFLSAPRAFGVMQDYVAHPAELCYKLPENVSSLEGALIEPLAVGIASTQRSGIRFGQSAAILGSGSIGLMTFLSLRAMGITDITMVDIYENRLEKARELGAPRTISAADGDPTDAVRAAHGGLGPDFVFETAGSPHTARQSLGMVKVGGAIMVIGVVVGSTPLDLQLAGNKELTLMTNFRYHNVHPIAIEAVASGKISLDGIVSDIYEFNQAPAAFEDGIERRESIVKSVLRFDV